MCSEKTDEEKNKKTLEILHLNVQSLKKNLDRLEALLHSIGRDIDIIICSETWMSKTKQHLCNLSGFNVIHVNAKINRADGVSIYINEKYNFEEVSAEFNDCTGKTIMLKIKDLKFMITGIYRSPSIKDTTRFLEGLEAITKKSDVDLKLIMGDFNIDILKEKKGASELKDLIAQNGYESLINEPTRKNPKGDDTCLDHAYLKCSSNEITYQAQVLEVFADHSPTLVKIFLHDVVLSKQENETGESVKIDSEKVAEMLENCSWENVVKSSGVDKAMEEFYTILNNCIDKCKIVKSIPINRKKFLKPWMTPGILKSINTKNKYYREWAKNKENEVYKYRFRAYRNKVDYIIKIAKECYFEKELAKCKNDPKKTWKFINKLGGREKAAGEKTESKVTAEELNTYFTEIGAELANKIKASSNNKKPPNSNCSGSFFLRPTTEDEVRNVINTMKKTMSCGSDLISVELLKTCNKPISKPLAHIANLMFTTGIFPAKLKEAVVTPIYKNKGNKDAPENYRPIAVLSNISKIFEKLLKSRLVNYLLKMKILSPNQFGFTPGKNTTQAVGHLVNKIANKLESKLKTLVVFIDITKAFDTVSHKLLIAKMERNGIRGVPLELFQSYLKNRTQKVKFKGKVSKVKEVLYGVPQGSVLGPLLFLIFINDLCNMKIKNCYISSFADDTAILFWADSWLELGELVNEVLNVEIMPWFRENLMTVNCAKTASVPFLTHAEDWGCFPDIIIHSCNMGDGDCNCTMISLLNETKYLGMMLDSFLSWRNHIEEVRLKLRKITGTIVNLKRYLQKDTLKVVYMALFQSLLAYGISNYGRAGTGGIQKLERSQRGIIKSILNLPKRYPSNELCSLMGVLSIEELYQIDLVKQIRTFLPFFEYDTINYNLRNREGNVAKAPVFRLEVTRSTAYKNTIDIYNALPLDLKYYVEKLDFGLLPGMIKRSLYDWVKSK